MSGYNLVRTVHILEEECDKLGFVMCHSKHRYGSEFGDVVAVKPKDQDSIPIYARDAELFIGTLNELSRWIEGIKWARQYDGMLFGKSHNEKRGRKEQDYRNKMLVNILKEEKID